MEEKSSKMSAVLKSSNFWTDIVTIALGVGFGVAGYFNALPDISASQSLGADVTVAVDAVKSGSLALMFTAAIKLYNTISHILKN